MTAALDEHPVAPLESHHPRVVHSRAGRSPEVRLVQALFEDAIRCVLGNLDARSSRGRREFAEARAWILDDDREWPFAFANVCELLGLDATAVRDRLPLWEAPLDRRAGRTDYTKSYPLYP